VRDLLLGLPMKGDIDIATSAPPGEIQKLFTHVSGVGEHFGVMLVIENGTAYEVATFRADIGNADGRHPQEVVFSTPREDAQRRDFTINGLFYDPFKHEVLDYVDGIADIRKGVIRAIGEPEQRFREDYLRLLRAIRFASRFGFTIESATWEAIGRNREGMAKVSQERIFQELSKMLTGPYPDRSVELLSESGLLGILLPEVEAMKGVEQPAEFHPEGDVFRHTVKALSFLENPSLVAAWSTLLHDIGKPSTMSRSDRVRFHNHDRIGAEMASRVLGRLKAPRALMECVFECIDNHMAFMNVQAMRLSTLKRFLARPTFQDELELHRVDCRASHDDMDNYQFLCRKRQELADEQLKPVPVLRGKDLIELGDTPGPAFGRILKAAYDLQLEEKLNTTEQAREWADAHRDEFANPGGEESQGRT
jgi:poly(A) polymerase